jgi:hypothetical protein
MLTQIGKVFFTIVLCVLLVGFGWCGVLGTVSGIAQLSRPPGGENLSGLLLVTGLGGLGIALASGWVLYQLWRKRPPAE